jgi:hypothetical protein
MNLEFNLYDFFGYIVPGAVIFCLFYWFVLSFLAFELIVDLSAIGTSILFIIIIYLLGHLSQAIGGYLGVFKAKKTDQFLSVRFLADDNDHFGPDFKTNIKLYASKIFSLDYEKLSFTEENLDEYYYQAQELFNLCYTFIIQEKSSGYVEVFNGLRGLFRGLTTSGYFGFLIAIVIVFKQLWLWLSTEMAYTLPEESFYVYEPVHLFFGLIMLLIFTIFIKICTKRLIHFQKYFVDAVYRNFYVYACSSNFLLNNN